MTNEIVPAVERRHHQVRVTRLIAGTLAAGLGLSTVSAGSAANNAPQGDTGCTALDPIALHFQEYGTPQDSGTAVIRDADAMAAYWRYLTGGNAIPAAIDSMQAGRITIAVHAGRRRSGGYSLDIARCQTIGRRIVVTVTLSPPEGAATRALTTPAAFWSIADPGMPVDVRLMTQEMGPEAGQKAGEADH